jgi:hypothetical protein
MTVLDAGAISITDGAIVLATEAVAPRLGLKPEALQAEMLRGQVFCLVETGVDEDEGRTRVTVRYHARSWTLVIEPDGKERTTTWSASAFPLKTRATSSDGDMTILLLEQHHFDGRAEAVAADGASCQEEEPNQLHPDQVAEQLRTCFQHLAAAGLTITYGGLAKLLELSPPNTIHQITVTLERLMEEDAEGGGRSLPRSCTERPGTGYRQWASSTARGALAGSPAIPMEWRLDLSTQPS